MDEASGNYFGKQLIIDYFYHKMPKKIAEAFENLYNLSPDDIKLNLYQKESPNAYLGNFAEFMFQFKETDYMHALIKKGFTTFFEYRILPYNKPATIPIYFIGSIAHYFKTALKEVAASYGLNIAGVLQRPIDNLIAYHQQRQP